MILVCPTCDAKFKIPDGAIPAGGRTVRCAKCKNSWHATPTDIVRKAAPKAPRPAMPRPGVPVMPPPPAHRAVSLQQGIMDEQASAQAASLRQGMQAAPEPEGQMAVGQPATAARPKETLFDEDEGLKTASSLLDDDLDDDVGTGVGQADDLGDNFGLSDKWGKLAESAGNLDYDEDYDEDDFLTARRADQRREGTRGALGRKRKIILGGWIALLVFLLATVYTLFFNDDFMKATLPGTDHALSSLGKSMSEKERFKPAPGEKVSKSLVDVEPYFRVALDSSSFEERDGVQGLVLKGHVENASPEFSRSARVPAVQATAFDRNGKVVDTWQFNAPQKILRWGNKSQFDVFHVPAPPGAVKITLAIVEDK